MKTYPLDPGISCPSQAPLSLLTEFRVPQISAMAAAMGGTQHVPVDWTKESELNFGSHEETAAGFWFSGPDSFFDLTNTIFNQLLVKLDPLRLPMEPGYGHWRDTRSKLDLLNCKISPAAEPVC